jgi:ArsR family transcriptional regulator, arsenate/arsenite/antimonite-responsive transcriptional repressor
MKKSTEMPLESLFQALADRTRLRLLNLLAMGEICVCYFVTLLDEPQPKISRHLAYLRRSGLVSARRDGKWIHYQLVTPSEPAAARLLRSLLEELRNDASMQRDVAALQRACCAVRLPPEIAEAPRPRLDNASRE